MNNKDLEFEFYSVYKNQDVEPMVLDDYIIGGDGLGGSGGFPHTLKPELFSDMENFKKQLLDTLLPFNLNFDEDTWFNQRVNTMIKPLLTSEPQASAEWGSRLVTILFTYAVEFVPDFKDVSDEATRNGLINFIYAGLKRVFDKFGFADSNYAGSHAFCTTLNVIKYKEEKDKVIAEALWAGDSRCYAFTSDGLKALSKDDQAEGSDAINNLFLTDLDGNGDVETFLNYRKFEVKKPCALWVCSDGIFDTIEGQCPNYGNVGVHAYIATALNNCNNFDELDAFLKQEYAEESVLHIGNTGLGVKHDDVTVGLKCFGINSFDEFKAFVIENKGNECIEEISKYFDDLDLIEKGEADEGTIQSYFDYPKKRANDKFESIINSYVNHPLSEYGDDFAWNENTTSLFNAACDEASKLSSDSNLTNLQKFIDDEKNKLFNNDPDALECFNSDYFTPDSEVGKLVTEFKKYMINIGLYSSQIEKINEEIELNRSKYEMEKENVYEGSSSLEDLKDDLVLCFKEFISFLYSKRLELELNMENTGEIKTMKKSLKIDSVDFSPLEIQLHNLKYSKVLKGIPKKNQSCLIFVRNITAILDGYSKLFSPEESATIDRCNEVIELINNFKDSSEELEKIETNFRNKEKSLNGNIKFYKEKIERANERINEIAEELFGQDINYYLDNAVVIFKQDLLDQYGISFENKGSYSLEDANRIFVEKMRENRDVVIESIVDGFSNPDNVDKVSFIEEGNFNKPKLENLRDYIRYCAIKDVFNDLVNNLQSLEDGIVEYFK